MLCTVPTEEVNFQMEIVFTDDDDDEDDNYDNENI